MLLALYDVTPLYSIEEKRFCRCRKTSIYYLMQEENPVWICVFNFRKADFDET